MTVKKKGLLKSLFKGSGGCNCGVQIIEEPKEKKTTKEKQKHEK